MKLKKEHQKTIMFTAIRNDIIANFMCIVLSLMKKIESSYRYNLQKKKVDRVKILLPYNC